MQPEDFTQALDRQARANDAMFAGDPGPYMAMWSHADDVTLFGAWGPCKTGWSEVARTLQWVGKRFGGGSIDFDIQVAHAGADTGYTVGYERGEVGIDGGPVQPITIRVTHAYRHEDGQWRIVHRHGDFAPLDQSPPDSPDR